MTLYNPPPLTFTPINTAQFDIVAGAAGWIDTDVSATTGVNQNRVWLISIFCVTANETSGVRTTGSAATPTQYGRDVVALAKVNNAGHLDLYRNAGSDIQYRIVGYLE